MSRIRQSRDPEVSLLQSAIDAVVMKNRAGVGIESLAKVAARQERPDIRDDAMVHQAAVLAMLMDKKQPIPGKPADHLASVEGVGQVAAYCAELALKLAKAIFLRDHAAEQACRDELTAKFGSCDARYVEAAEQAAVYFGAMHGQIPYVDWQAQTDYVIDDAAVLPDKAVVGIIGDWGTGQDHACEVLGSLAAHNPDIVIHLGDVYYSGVEHEMQGFFFEKWCSTLKLSFDQNRRVTTARPRSFSLAGNHDMYCGGVPYYKMIQQLGQRASFFCVRNKNWQFIGLDTGFFDHEVKAGNFTRLPPRQAEWLKDKVDGADGRKTVLLSHHQLFSSNESFQNGGDTNTSLLADVQTVLPNVHLWIWGHEHDLVVFKEHAGLKRGRCVGHGAYPVGFAEIPDPPKRRDLLQVARLLPKGKSFFNNGYAVMEIDGPSAKVTYYACDDNANESVFFTEPIG
jgi:3',5'-cyclic AMP phosphodiesterase CpdA